MYDPFAEGALLDPNQYMDFLQQPLDQRLAAGGLSAGLALMQPPRWGDTPLSQLSRAIGTGGEAIAQSEASDRAAKESDAKIAANEARATSAQARADAAATRAGAAGDRASYQGERLALQRQNIENLNERSRLSRLVQANGQYQQYRKAIEARNNDPLSRTQEPVLDFNTWLTNSGLGGLLIPGSGTDQGTLGAAIPGAGSPPSVTSTPEPPPGFRIVK